MADNIELFKENLKKLYPGDYTSILKGLSTVLPTTFRINRQNANPPEVLESLTAQGLFITKGPIDNSYIIKDTKRAINISDTKEYQNGQIYVQELSSMIPPLVLNPNAGEYVMDMAAAPGSKTTQLAELAENKANIVALEKHPIRIQTLEYNVKLQKSENIKIIQGNGIKFDKRNPQYVGIFDKVLADVPCSTEGKINLKNPRSYKFWNPWKYKSMTSIQKGILISGIRMLKSGGTLVYSTCTFNIEENEKVLDWLLSKIPELELEEIKLPMINTKRGITKWDGKELNPKIKKSLRILPDGLFTGFFIAKIKKPKQYNYCKD